MLDYSKVMNIVAYKQMKIHPFLLRHKGIPGIRVWKSGLPLPCLDDEHRYSQEDIKLDMGQESHMVASKDAGKIRKL